MRVVRPACSAAFTSSGTPFMSLMSNISETGCVLAQSRNSVNAGIRSPLVPSGICVISARVSRDSRAGTPPINASGL